MATWTPDELAKIAAAEELELASVRHDGRPGKPVTIWVVRVGDDLYVRSWKGDAGAWFRATQVRHAWWVSSARTTSSRLSSVLRRTRVPSDLRRRRAQPVSR